MVPPICRFWITKALVCRGRRSGASSFLHRLRPPWRQRLDERTGEVARDVVRHGRVRLDLRTGRPLRRNARRRSPGRRRACEKTFPTFMELLSRPDRGRGSVLAFWIICANIGCAASFSILAVAVPLSPSTSAMEAMSFFRSPAPFSSMPISFNLLCARPRPDDEEGLGVFLVVGTLLIHAEPRRTHG